MIVRIYDGLGAEVISVGESDFLDFEGLSPFNSSGVFPSTF
jgi:hypothetical protein